MSNLRHLEGEVRQATGLLACAMRRYADPGTGVSDAEGTAALLAAWKAKAKASPDAQPVTTLEIITMEAAEAMEAASVVRRAVDAARAEVLERTEALRHAREEEAYRARKSAKEASEERKLRRAR